MTVSPATQALLDKAYSDLATAQVDDGTLASLQAALAKAQADVIAEQATNLQEHKAATASAHDALAALAKELNFPLPEGF